MSTLQEHEKRTPGSRAYAITALRVGNNPLSHDPDASPERWDLHEYTEVTAHLGLITPDTAAQTRLLRRYRNLIHPGRAARLGQKCDRSTALAALAAVESAEPPVHSTWFLRFFERRPFIALVWERGTSEAERRLALASV
jgi:hypothetical protein